MTDLLLMLLLGICLGFGLAALLAAGQIQRTGKPGQAGDGRPGNFTYHYDD